VKLAYFNDFQLGVVVGEGIVDVTPLLSDIPARDRQDLMPGLIARWDAYRPKLKAAAKGAGIPLAEVKLRAPLPRPRQIDCMAVNYMEDGTLPEPAAINAFH
jgi:hypothetical protein